MTNNQYNNDINKTRRLLLQMGVSAGLLAGVSFAMGQPLMDLTTKLSSARRETTKRIADILLPPTDSPSATMVGAETFALDVIFSALASNKGERFIQDLSRFEDEFSQQHKGLTFILANKTMQEEYILTLLTSSHHTLHPFITKFRQYVIIGWVLNEQIAKNYFNYTRTLGRYEPSSKSDKEMLVSNLDRLYI